MAQAAEVLETQLLAAIAAGTEGLMLKFLDERSAYKPSKRSDSWLKVKKDYCEGLRDSLDLVRPCCARALPMQVSCARDDMHALSQTWQPKRARVALSTEGVCV